MKNNINYYIIKANKGRVTMPKFKTSLGTFIYNERDKSNEFLGIKYANANRFEYANLIDKYGKSYDATKMGASCTQKRTYNAHLDVPARLFYHNEFRRDLAFEYSEDCLFLNIWTPKEDGIYPVMVFIHGGGFDSGSISEHPFDGNSLANKGIIVVTIQYRVGPFGYLTNEELSKRNGRDGNFGLDDQYKALLWVKKNISEFKGNPECITVAGQSAGAMSIQYLTLYKECKGLFHRAIMMSGGGLWPKFSLPKPCETTRWYWDEVIKLSGCKNIDEFKTLPADKMFLAIEQQIAKSKNNTYYMMPVIDNYYLTDSVDVLINNPMDIDYMLGYTNNDLFTLILANMAIKYTKKVNGYLYFFDVDAKGDKNKAFHSSDLRYMFNVFDDSWRPYDDKDKEISNLMMDYFVQFVKTGNPNKDGLPVWNKVKPLRISDKKKIKNVRPNKMSLLINTLRGDVK